MAAEFLYVAEGHVMWVLTWLISKGQWWLVKVVAGPLFTGMSRRMFIAMIGLLPAEWNLNPCLHPWGGCWSRGDLVWTVVGFFWGLLNCGSITTSFPLHFEDIDLDHHVFVSQDAETLEVETKRFEDLEFQQLERESRQDEEKETQTQHILREIAAHQRSTVTRKVSFLLVPSSHPGKFLLWSKNFVPFKWFDGQKEKRLI